MSQSAKPKTEVDEAAMRAKGVVPRISLLPDVNSPGFHEAINEEARRLAEADEENAAIERFSEAALQDIWDEIDELERAAGLTRPDYIEPT